MKTWRWIVALSVIMSIGVLVMSGLLAGQIRSEIEFPVKWLREQALSGRSFEEQPGTLVASIGGLFTLCFSGILVLYVVPDRVRCVVDSFPRKIGPILRLTVLGFLIEVLTLAIGISSALMIGTFPLMMLLVGTLFIVGFLGLVSLAYALGRNLLNRANWRRTSPIIALLFGILILFALVRIPVFGGALLLMITSFGLGTTVVSHFGSGKPWTLTSLLEE